MHERIAPARAYQLQPQILASLRALGEAATSLEPGLIHLVNVRASQLNGCAYCLNMHNGEARRDGEDQARLDLLPAWREAPCFTERERAALSLCETLTCLAGNGPVTDRAYEQVRTEFSEKEVMDLIAVIVVINGWNRVVATAGFKPSLEAEVGK
ncbi:carboxymuconolactone decarboxylase family protein [Gilvimarinus sp. F26214L]|uniref:carboxymuconolactone decarboxylase family protein n=1 Tax=Gilvimarinus sp. DZF01 TaxID=3461371 RepID=UPI00404539E2